VFTAVEKLRTDKLLQANRTLLLNQTYYIDGTNFCDGQKKYCAQILDGVMKQGFIKSFSAYKDIYQSLESNKYVRTIKWESFLSRGNTLVTR
jgi:hypothetical protein